VNVDLKVDWLAFTIPLIAGTRDQSPDTLAFMQNAVHSFTNGLLRRFDEKSDLELQNASGFYSVRLVDTITTLRMSWGDINSHVYVELPGTACQMVSEAGNMSSLIALVKDRCSRIDIAGDWECEHEPRIVIGNAYETGRRSFSQIRSNEGLTIYVGSRKSDRFLRVYRYRSPHPRSKFLRFEHENKGDVAKTVCNSVLETGLEATFGAQQNSYKWDLLDVLGLSKTTGKISSDRANKDDVSTLLWLLETVAPAIVKASKSGLIDLDTFIEKEIKAKFSLE
jgi:DNA relaxase NicK